MIVIPMLIPWILAEFSLTYLAAGIIGLVFQLTAGISNPAVGYISDKTGRRRFTFTAGIFGFFLGLALFGVSSSLLHLMIFSVIAGVGASAYHPQAVSFINFNFRERRGFALGIHGVFGALGFAASPILISYVAGIYGWRFSPLIFAPQVFVVILLILSLFRDPVNPIGRKPDFAVLKKRPVIFLIIISVAIAIPDFIIVLFLPIYFVEVEGFSILAAGLFISLRNVGGIVGQFAGGYYSDKVGSRNILVLGSLFFSLTFYAFLATSQNFFLHLTMLFLSRLFLEALYPSLMSASAQYVSKETVATTYALIQGVTFATVALIALVVGAFADVFGLTLAIGLSVTPIFLAAVVSFRLPKHSIRR